ncbi:pyrimidine dimer DNA glycosylase/endonuclease V [Akkermansia sp.]|uniref:pyrimidine dimer DNA glycosylase/endonuclease V n=1 Tax=Akkermansia sp. TaxID=1872421 RepID=UPI003A939EBA
MRLWSLHPSYLDAIGLIALWREGLLARKVLLGQTKGYTRHPQLIRFRETGNLLQTMDLYLKAVHEESIRRGYSFDLSKISPCACQPSSRLLLPDKQLEYEFHHLLNKLRKRSPQQYYLLQQTTSILPHPLFQVVPGDICTWEKYT